MLIRQINSFQPKKSFQRNSILNVSVISDKTDLQRYFRKCSTNRILAKLFLSEKIVYVGMFVPKIISNYKKTKSTCFKGTYNP